VIPWFRDGGACRRGSIEWQVGEQGAEFFPGAGAQGLPGSLIEFVGCDPANLEGFAQLGLGPVAVGVRYPEVARRKAPADFIHNWYS
jgi:hypothetical protein